MPDRLTKEPQVKDRVVDLENMLSMYYKIRGWDEYGVLSGRKLKKLGI